MCMNVVYICRMDIDPDKLLPYLTQVEEVAEDILSDKQQLIDLDRRRQKTREAIRLFLFGISSHL